jgi:type IV secretory pathway VirB10-like protein
MATASARRQALADLARARTGDSSAAVLVRRSAIAVVILGFLALAVLWMLGFFSTPKELRAVQTLVDQQVAELQRVARNEAPFGSGGESFGTMFETIRQVPEAYRDQARSELGRLFEARETAEVNSFFGMPPEQRMAELDRRIRAEEERRKAWEARRRPSEERRSERPAPSGERADRSAGTGGGGRSPQASGPGRGIRTEEGRNLRAKSRIDRTSAETRARRTEYRRLKDQRRIELGIAPRR